MITLRTQLVFLLLLPRISDQDVQSEDDFDFNLYNFLKIFQNLKIYLRSEPYLPVGKTIRTFVQGCAAIRFRKEIDLWIQDVENYPMKCPGYNRSQRKLNVLLVEH